MVFGQRGTRPSGASHTAAAFYMHRRCRHLPTYAQSRLESAFAGYPTIERGYGRLQPSTCFAAHDDDDLIPEERQSPVFNVDLSRIRLNDALIFHGLDFVYDNFASRIDKRQHKDQLGTGSSYGFLFLTAYDRALFIKIFNRWSRLRYNSGRLHPFCSISIHPGTNQKSPILRLLFRLIPQHPMREVVYTSSFLSHTHCTGTLAEVISSHHMLVYASRSNPPVCLHHHLPCCTVATGR
ncbi:hypothetical protein BZA70DRAFT_310143 [Myxozyma melibiosi]|uniref:Uncharacterized protein n=1 Tax=Myxozyma melibiosi TaxID=54550 RepID=A0ABR1F9C3_9ASCO